MLTIGQVAKKYSLSRSTLIYYDFIGLLAPSDRSEANYRLYDENDLKKMDKIILFRNAGLTLAAISKLLDKDGDELNAALESRLSSINSEIQELREQQNIILKILEQKNLIKHIRVVDKDTWVAMLQAAGLDEQGMKKWHIQFEQTSPEAHQDFLESLGIEKDEIKLIRHWSKNIQK